MMDEWFQFPNQNIKLPTFGLDGKVHDTNAQDEELLDMTYSRKLIKEKVDRIPLGHKPLVPIYGLKKEKAEYSKTASGNKWQIWGNYEKKLYPRKGIVKFSYTSRTVFEPLFRETKSGVKYESNNRCSNVSALKDFIKNGGDLNLYMRTLNAHRVSYISRDEATVENLPDELSIPNDMVIYTYIDGDKQMLRNVDAINLIDTDSTFNLVLSPEDPNVDLDRMTYLFMEKFLKKVKNGTPRFWFAANHYNTNHPHVHVVVSKIGKENNKELFVPKDFNNIEMSRVLGKCLDFQLGMRSWKEESQIRDSKAKSFGFIAEDNIILKQSEFNEEGKYLLTMKKLGELSKSVKDTVRRRLWNLKNKKLAMYRPELKAWVLNGDFDKELKKDTYMKLFGFNYENPEERAKYTVHKKTKDEKGFIGIIADFHKVENEENRMIFLIKDNNDKYHFYEEYIDPTENKPQKNTVVELERTENGLQFTHHMRTRY